MIQCQVDISQRLGLYALCRIHHQNRAVTGRQAAGYFIIKVDMTGRVDHVQNIFLSILRPVNNAAGLGLDRNAPLPLQLHIVQYLALHLTAGQQTGLLYDTVRQCRFAMVDVRDDTKISDFTLFNC